MDQGRIASINFEQELNDEQFAAVSAPFGPSLVLAGAGSGKTRTLTYRVAWLLAQGVKPWEILLLTFTNKAAKEMTQRVEQLTGHSAQSFWSGTFHSIGARILRSHAGKLGLDSSFTILDEGEAQNLLKEVIQARDAAYLKIKDNPKPNVLLGVYSYARNTQQSIHAVTESRFPWMHSVERVIAFFQGYQTLKRERNLLDYDDLLIYWQQLLQDHPDVACIYQQRLKHILVDEYQDTNQLQSDIIDRIGTHHQIMAVGDDAQCIYTWRGADIDNILSFTERHKGARIFKIQKNYRSTPEILNLANHILKGSESVRRFEKDLIAVKPSKMKPMVVSHYDGRDQAAFLLKRIHGLLGEGYDYSDIAVLYRAHYQAMDAELEFSRNRIPFVMTSGLKFFEQAHIKDVIAHVRFIVNPKDSQAFERMLGLLPKVGPKTAQRIFEEIHKIRAYLIEKARKPMTDLFQSAQISTEPSLGRAVCSETVLSKIPSGAQMAWKDLAETLRQMEQAMLEPDKDPATRLRNMVGVACEGWYDTFMKTTFQNYQERKQDFQGLIDFAGRYNDANEMLSQVVLLSAEMHEESQGLQQNNIRLTTIHQAKGLEFPVVFIIGLADGLFPIKRVIEEGDLEEERRLFYVAVTRAQDQLYLSYPTVINFNPKQSFKVDPSRFLLELPEKTYDILHARSRYY
jgi:DNA helicase-2/ATP-dependent DNA helicase PcrA